MWKVIPLHVGTKDNYWLRPGRKVKIFVSSPDYESIRSYGSGDIIENQKLRIHQNLN